MLSTFADNAQYPSPLVPAGPPATRLTKAMMGLPDVRHKGVEKADEAGARMHERRR